MLLTVQKMIDYYSAFSSITPPFVMTIVGFVASWAKMLNNTDGKDIFRALMLVVIPGLMFNQISIQRDRKPWNVFLNELLIQGTIHIVALIICYVFPFKHRYHTFVESILTVCYPNYFSYGGIIVYYLYGSEYLYVPVFQSIVQFLILIPLHTFLAYSIPKSYLEQTKEKGDEFERIGQRNPEDIEHGENKAKKSLNDNKDDKELSRGWETFWKFATSINVCTFLGIFWAAGKVKTPVFLKNFLQDLENAAYAAQLYIIGVFLYGFKPQRKRLGIVVLYIFLIYIVVPLVAMFWCYICNFEYTVSKIIILIHASPLDLFGILMAKSKGRFRDIHYTFYWSQYLAIPVLMAWYIIIEECNFLK